MGRQDNQFQIYSGNPMTALPFGVRFYRDDDEIRLLLESVQLWAKVQSIASTEGIFVYDNLNPPERWIIQNFSGTDDPGWVICVYPHDSMDVPAVQASIHAIEINFGITKANFRSRLIAMPIHRPDLTRN